MHSLLLLYKLQGKALVRRMTRNLGTVKGILFSICGVAVIGLWLTPSVFHAMKLPRTDPQIVLKIAPAILLAFGLFSLLTAGGEKAIVFTPAEVDFLFPGPFTRRQLLAYKIGKSLFGLLFSSLLLSYVFLQHAASWPFAFVGLFAAMLFLQLVSMSLTLITQSAGERAYTNIRKIVLVLVIFAIAAAVLPRLKTGGQRGFLELAQSVQTSRIGSILLAPLEVFGRLFVSERWWPDGVINFAMAMGINGVLLLIVFFLDADYLEAAATKSQAMHARLQRVRKGGISAFARPGKTAKWSFPRVPFFAGAGPIAWRQATVAMRNSRGLLFILVIMACGIAPISFNPGNADNINVALITAMAWMTLIVGSWLRFDFRGDLDLLDHLKSLPISARAISVGQMITPTLMMTACNLIVIICASLMLWRQPADFHDPSKTHDSIALLASAAVLCLPFNTLMIGVENFMFLIFPTRAAATPGDFQGYGRQILMVFAKFSIVLVVGAIAGGAGLLVHFLTHSKALAVLVSAIALAAFALATIPAVAWAFRRFDVSGDLPA